MAHDFFFNLNRTQYIVISLSYNIFKKVFIFVITARGIIQLLSTSF